MTVRQALLLLAVPLTALAGEPSPVAKTEIDHLLAYLERSGCEFSRNGSWYDAAKARAHLDEKYQYLVKKGMVSSAEDFIGRAASESSVTGKAYQVRCAGAAPVPSALWLKSELTRYRAGKR